MENLNTALHASKFNNSSSIMERSQVQILAIGYQVVMLKSKLKKQLKILISALLFNF
jgi:hypothetical protein